MLGTEHLGAHVYWDTYVPFEIIGLARHGAAPAFFGPQVTYIFLFPCRKKYQNISHSVIFGAGVYEELSVCESQIWPRGLFVGIDEGSY